jgi:hypothetical protein
VRLLLPAGARPAIPASSAVVTVHIAASGDADEQRSAGAPTLPNTAQTALARTGTSIGVFALLALLAVGSGVALTATVRARSARPGGRA